MKTNRVKQKLRAGEATFGTWISLGNLHATRVLARMGFDWLTVDIEHSPFDWSQAAVLFAAIADGGCVPLARVPEGSHAYIKRALDAGAWGIVVPMVNTEQEAQRAIRAAKYPPEGNRSAGGGMHSLNFAASVGEYYERANEEIVVILQTESPRGIANAEAIYGLEGFDAVFVGPVDLRFNMRHPDGTWPSDQEHEAAIQEVIRIGKQLGKPTGMHCLEAADAKLRAEQGMQFLAVGSDLRMLGLKAAEIVGELWPEKGQQDLARY